MIKRLTAFLFLIHIFSCSKFHYVQDSKQISTSVDQGIAITTGSSITVSFLREIIKETVTTTSLFVVQNRTSVSSVSTSSFVDTCNTDNAVASKVSCLTSTECSIEPELKDNTSYTLCVTNKIKYLDNFKFVGKTVPFVVRNNDQPENFNVTISSSQSVLTTQNPFPMTVTFSKEVSSFSLSDITLANAVASGLSTVDNKTYTMNITPSSDPASITAIIAAGVVQGIEGGINNISNIFSIIYDTSFLTVDITSSSSDPTNESPIPVTITFSEAVTGFILGDITVTNGTASNLNTSGNPIFTADITPSSEGEVSIKINADLVVDQATGAKYNQASATVTRNYDITAPDVESTTPNNGDTGVIVSTTGAVTFTKAMNTATVTTNTADTGCSGSLQVSSDNFNTCVRMSGAPVASNGDKTFTITPASNLSYSNIYKIRVTIDIADKAGNQLSGEYTQATGFTTVSAPDVESTAPNDGATGVSLSTTGAVTFTKAMNTATVTTNTADTSCSGSLQVSSDNFNTCVRMSGAPVASNGDKTFTITPASNLSSSSIYKIRVTVDVEDTEGAPLLNEYTQATGFTTVSAPKILRILSTTNTNGNMGGVAGADALCVGEFGAGYKALVVADTGVPATSRIACTSSNCTTGGISENVNWVLKPNTSYSRSDGTPLFTTNSAAIFPSDSNLTNSIAGAYAFPMTGLRMSGGPAWTVYTGYNCSNWTSTSGNVSSANNAQIVSWVVFGGNGTANPSYNCSVSNRRLICVQQ